MKISYILFLFPFQLFLNPLVLAAQVASAPNFSLPEGITKQLCTDEEMRRLTDYIKKCQDHPRKKDCKRLPAFRDHFEACSAYRRSMDLPSKETLEAFLKKVHDILAKQGGIRENQENLFKQFQEEIDLIKKHQRALLKNQSRVPVQDSSFIQRQIDKLKEQNGIFNQRLEALELKFQELSEAKKKHKELEDHTSKNPELLEKSTDQKTPETPPLAQTDSQVPSREEKAREEKDISQNRGKDLLPSLDKSSDNKVPPPSTNLLPPPKNFLPPPPNLLSAKPSQENSTKPKKPSEFPEIKPSINDEIKNFQFKKKPSQSENEKKEQPSDLPKMNSNLADQVKNFKFKKKTVQSKEEEKEEIQDSGKKNFGVALKSADSSKTAAQKPKELSEFEKKVQEKNEKSKNSISSEIPSKTSQDLTSEPKASEVPPLLAQESQKQEHPSPEEEKLAPPAKFKKALKGALKSMPKAPQNPKEKSTEDDFYKLDEELPPSDPSSNNTAQEKPPVIEQNPMQTPDHSSSPEAKQADNSETSTTSSQGAPPPHINQILHEKLEQQHALMSRQNMDVITPLLAEIKEGGGDKINEAVLKYKEKIPTDEEDLKRFLTDLNEQMISEKISAEQGQKIQEAVRAAAIEGN